MNADRDKIWPRNKCPECGIGFGYHEIGCSALHGRRLNDIRDSLSAAITRATLPDGEPS